jgi:multiple sugar transport system permease protein
MSSARPKSDQPDGSQSDEDHRAPTPGLRHRLSNGFSNGLDNDGMAAGLLLAPAVVLLGLFVIWPIGNLAYLSVTQGGGGNYQRLLSNSEFWQVLGNTMYFTVATVLPSLVLPLGLAVGLDRLPAGPWRGALRAAYFLPSITSLVAVGLGWRWLFQADGPVNGGLGWLGIGPTNWLGSPVWAMPVLILLGVWKQLGFNMVVFLAGLQMIPASRYEAAALDGANGWQQFRYITLPGLRPTLVFVAVTTAIFSLRNFESVYVVTGGGPGNATNLLVYYIYQQAFVRSDFGYAAAGAMVLLALALLLVVLQLRLEGPADDRRA